jgi:hypothetical protein
LGAGLDPARLIPVGIFENIRQQQIRLGEQMTAVLAPAMERFAASIAPILDSWSAAFARARPGLLRSLELLYRTVSYPPNWRGLESLPEEHLIDRILLDEGLPLAWLPDERTLRQLFEAESAQARRRILGRKRPELISQCVYHLDQIHDSELIRYVRFGRAAARCLEIGEYEAAQALATNVLDSILREQFGSGTAITNQNSRFARGEWHPQVALALAGIWGIHAKAYRPAPVPRTYNRHATAHRVSGWQYNRINATIALMHTVGLMRSLQLVEPAERARQRIGGGVGT